MYQPVIRELTDSLLKCKDNMINEITRKIILQYLNGEKDNFDIQKEEIDQSGYLNDLSRYLRGEIVDFEKYQIDLLGLTEFQQLVLHETRNIPYGKTRTYGEVANLISKDGAARAVGNALSKNPYPIVIPCHRVVAKNGIGGWFNGRTKLKKKLLLLEAYYFHLALG